MILPAGEPVRFWTQKFLRRTSMANEERGGPRPKPTGLAEARQGNLRGRVTPHCSRLSPAYSRSMKLQGTCRTVIVRPVPQQSNALRQS